jgi:hypothetical protein
LTLTLDEADEAFEAITLQSLWQALEKRFPGSLQRVVNQGMLGDEYHDFKRIQQ